MNRVGKGFPKPVAGHPKGVLKKTDNPDLTTIAHLIGNHTKVFLMNMKFRRATNRFLVLMASTVFLSACQVEDVYNSIVGNDSENDKYPFIIKADEESVFTSELNQELIKLQAEDPVAYNELRQAIYRIIVYKDVDPSPMVLFESGIPSTFPIFETVEVGRIANQLYPKVQDKLDKGVTKKSLINLGLGHKKNAVTKYQNAAYLYIETLEEQKAVLGEKRSSILSRMNDLIIIDPTFTYGPGETPVFTAQMMNKTGREIKSVEMVVTNNQEERNITLDRIIEKDSIINFSKNVDGIVEGKIRSQVVQLKFTDEEYLDMRDIRTEFNSINREIQAVNDFRNRIPRMIDEAETELFKKTVR